MKRIYGAVLVAILVFAVAGIWRYSSYIYDSAFKKGPAVFADRSIRASSPQEYLLLGQRMDINTATQEMFEALPGVGPSIAKRIVEYREKHGPFKDIHELDDVSGVGPTLVEKLMPYLK